MKPVNTVVYLAANKAIETIVYKTVGAKTYYLVRAELSVLGDTEIHDITELEVFKQIRK